MPFHYSYYWWIIATAISVELMIHLFKASRVDSWIDTFSSDSELRRYQICEDRTWLQMTVCIYIYIRTYIHTYSFLTHCQHFGETTVTSTKNINKKPEFHHIPWNLPSSNLRGDWRNGAARSHFKVQREARTGRHPVLSVTWLWRRSIWWKKITDVKQGH